MKNYFILLIYLTNQFMVKKLLGILLDFFRVHKVILAPKQSIFLLFVSFEI